MTASFTDAMALRRGRARRIRGVLKASSTSTGRSGPRCTAARCWRCAPTPRAPPATGSPPGLEPVAVSASFLSAPDPGPMRLVTSVRKRGRRISVVDVELTQGERTAVHAVVTLGEPEHFARRRSAPAVGEPGAGADGAGTARRHRADRARPSAGRPGAPGGRLRRAAAAVDAWRSRDDGRPPMIQMWVRPRGAGPGRAVRADVRRRVGAGDLRRGPHRLGADRAAHRLPARLCPPTAGCGSSPPCMEIGQDWFDEDHIVVDSVGRLVVQTRQLALVPAAASPANSASAMLSGMARIAIIGGGSIGEALLSGLLRAGRQVKDLVVAETRCPSAPSTWPRPTRCW